MNKPRPPRECCRCHRTTGSLETVAGEPDEDPLGPVRRCQLCKRWACPECLFEAECCFAEESTHAGDQKWSPRGWVRVSETEWQPKGNLYPVREKDGLFES